MTSDLAFSEVRCQTASDTIGGVVSPWPPVFGVSANEWRVLVTARPNVLLVGDERVTSEILGALLPSLREPVWMTMAASLLLPSESPATLIVPDVTRLAADDQVRLFHWLSEHPPGVQVVTTAPTPLLPLVRRGAFFDALYYRLNVVYLKLGRPPRVRDVAIGRVDEDSRSARRSPHLPMSLSR